MHVLTSPSELGVETLPQLLYDISLLSPPPGDVLIDCRRLKFVKPSGMAALLAIVDVLFSSQRGRRVGLHFSDRDDVNAYMHRMGLFDMLGLTAPPRRRRDLSAELCELSRIDDRREVDAIANRLVGIASNQLMLGEGIDAAMKLALSEVLDNVLSHASAAIPGYVCAQTFRRQEAVEFAIVDTGVGILGSAHGVRELRSATHEDAIRWAINRGNTSKPVEHTGIGLFMARRMIENNSGTMWIYSGEAIVSVTARSVDAAGASGWPGTIVVLTFRTDRAVNVRNVLERDFGSEAEGGQLWG